MRSTCIFVSGWAVIDLKLFFGEFSAHHCKDHLHALSLYMVVFVVGAFCMLQHLFGFKIDTSTKKTKNAY